MIPFVILAIENEEDQRFMADVYLRYERLMMSTIRKIIKTAPCEVEDIFQSLLLNLIRNVDKLKSMDKPALTSYIVVAAQNTSRDALRKQRRAESRSIDDDTWFKHDKLISHEDTLDVVFRREDMRMLDESLNLLSEHDAYLIRAKYILGIDNNEISKYLGIKPDSVRMELSRARKKLSAIMAEKASTKDA